MAAFIKSMETVLKRDLSVDHLDIVDLSDLHAGHAEARQRGGGHYRLLIVSQDFRNKKLLERHRMINQALKRKFKKEIHALAIEAYTPEEFSSFQ